MQPINAIAKVRFNSAKGQRVHLVEEAPLGADLLCLESGQQLSVPAGLLYIVTGSASISQNGGATGMAAGQLMAVAENAAIVNDSQQRLVCLSFQTAQ
jgi:hypothetical protein